MGKLQIMDTTIRDGQQSLWATRMPIGDRGLGRCYVRHLPALPRRKPLGSLALYQVEDPQYASFHAVPWTEPGGLQALFQGCR